MLQCNTYGSLGGVIMGIITVRLNEDTVKELDNVAKDTGRSIGNVIKRAINF